MTPPNAAPNDGLRIVDAHQHFWDLRRNYHPWLCDEPPIAFRYGDYRALRRDYLPPDYRADSAGHDVVATVYVEAEWNPRDPIGETRWVHALHRRCGLPNAVVAQAWLDGDDVEQVLAQQAAFALVRSVRHKPRAGSLRDPKWRAGFARLAQHGLAFDLQAPYACLADAYQLAAAFPEVPIVLNHTGLPADRSAKGLNAWRRAMRTLAQAAQVSVKISGLGVPGQPWTVANNRAVVLDTIDIFGVQRCMFASNFPVDGLVADFDTIFSGFKAIVGDFSRAEQEKLFHDNAARIYRIASTA